MSRAVGRIIRMQLAFSLHAFLTVTICILFSRLSYAQNADGTQQPCQRLQALRALEPTDRQNLVGACKSLYQVKFSAAKEQPDDRKRLATALTRLPHGPQRALLITTITELLQQSQLFDRGREAKLEASIIRLLRAGNEIPACFKLRKKIETGVREITNKRAEDNDNIILVKENDLEQSSDGGNSCQTQLGPYAEMLKTHKFITVIADQGSYVDLAMAGSTPNVWRASEATSSFEVHGKRVYLIALPRGEPFTVRVKHRGIIRVDDSILVDNSDTFPKYVSAMHCVDIRLRKPEEHTDSRYELLLNGDIAHPGINYVLPGWHEAVVIDREEKSSPDGSAPAFARVETNKRGICEVVTFDVRRNIEAAIATVRLDDTCKARGLDADLIEQRTLGILQEIFKKESVLDLRGFASRAAGAKALAALLTIQSSDSDRPERGSFETKRQLDKLSGELLDEGVRRLISVDLRCINRESSQTYSLAVTSFDLENLRTRPSERRTSRSVDNATGVEAQTVHSEQDLHKALEWALANLLSKRLHLRFVSGDLSQSIYNFGDPVVEIFMPERGNSEAPSQSFRLHMAARRLEWSERSYCSALEDQDRLFGGRVPHALKESDNWYNLRTEDITPEEKSAITSRSVPLSPALPGLYLVKVTAQPLSQSASASRVPAPLTSQQSPSMLERCFDVQGFPLELWAQVIGTTVAWSPQFGDVDRNVTNVNFRAGFQRSSSHIRSWGLRLGFGKTSYQLDSPVSWDDVFSRRYASPLSANSTTRGKPLRWSKTSGSLGYMFRYETLPCTWGSSPRCGIARRLFLGVAASAWIDVGFLNISEIPAEYSEFLDTRRGAFDRLDIDVGGAVEVFVKAKLMHHTTISLGLEGQLSAIDDLISSWVPPDRKQPLRRVNYDGHFLLAPTLRFGVNL